MIQHTYNKKTGQFDETYIETDDKLVFSTGTNAPVHKLKPKDKNDNNHRTLRFDAVRGASEEHLPACRW